MLLDELVRGLYGQAGVLSLFIIIAITGAMGKWVFGYVVKESMADKDKQIAAAEARAARWEAIALKALNVGEKVVDKNERSN